MWFGKFLGKRCWNWYVYFYVLVVVLMINDWFIDNKMRGWVGGGWSFWLILEMISSTCRDGGVSFLRLGVLIVGDLYF